MRQRLRWIHAGATPCFCKACTVSPYAMREKVEEDLDRLVAEGTLEPIDYSDWVAPIIAVMKSDRKSVHICGDYRMTITPVSKLNRYPIPKTEHIFATLKQGKLIHRAGSEPGIPAAQAGGVVKQVRDYWYPQGPLPLHTPAIRYHLCPRNISENHGAVVAGYSTCCHVY